MNDAREILMSGSSAGGIGTFYNIDWLVEAFPNAWVKKFVCVCVRVRTCVCVKAKLV